MTQPAMQPAMEPEGPAAHVKPEWRQAFSHFVETGEASKDFLVYLDGDEDAQRAVEIAFKAQAAAFESLADELKKAPAGAGEPEHRRTEDAAFVQSLSARVADTIEKISDLPAERQEEALDKAALFLRTSPKRSALRCAVERLEKAL